MKLLTVLKTDTTSQSNDLVYVHTHLRFTKGFLRPFDERIFVAMLHTTRDLVAEFNAATGYTQSDEITLVFPPQYEESKENPGKWKIIGTERQGKW